MCNNSNMKDGNLLHTLILFCLVTACLPAISCNNNIDTNSLENDILVLTTKIPLAGVNGRIDHLTYDSVHHLVFVAALGNNTVEVVNTITNQRVHTITGLHGPQGVCYIPSVNRLVVANGDNGDCVFYECINYSVIKHIQLSGDADNTRFDAANNTVFVGYGDGGISVIDVVKMEQVATIQLDGHPESFQLDEVNNKLFINVPDAHEIQVASLKTHQVIGTWKNDGASANFPMALDANNKRLFVVYRHPASIKVLNTETGQVIQSIRCSGDADDIFYDNLSGLLFVSCGDGFIDAVKMSGGDYKLINHIKNSSGARTSLWIPSEKKLLLAVPVRGGNDAALWVYKLKP